MRKIISVMRIFVHIGFILFTVVLFTSPISGGFDNGNDYIAYFDNSGAEDINIYQPESYDYRQRATVAILMYHHLAESAYNDWTVTPESFERQMQWLVANGFNTVSLLDLYNFVHFGTELPENPVVITFDDGYLSVYEYAFPVLYRYGLRASIFVIGSQVGTSYYKDTGHPTTPKFCFEQARSMVSTGLIEIQSHTYDMHQWAPFEPGLARENILIMQGESYADYIAVLTYDHLRISNLIETETGQRVFAVAFPFGIYDELSLDVLQSLGVSVTLTVAHGFNIISEGAPESLHLLNRKNVTDALDEYEFLNLLRQ
jgi:peptidoglycan/xylan/chitin deacetylase (PgdA/CDA1 family)